MRVRAAILILLLLCIVLACGCMLTGAVDIPASEVWRSLTGQSENTVNRVIVIETRLPMMLTALTAGAALSIAGLLLQTTFNNPLAGPSILGVSTGASLGVAVALLGAGGVIAAGFGTYLVTIVGASAGSGIIILLLLIFSRLVKSTGSLLIVGILIGYFASSGISLLNFYATQQGLQSYVVWGMGSFSGVTLERLPLLIVPVMLLLICSMLFAKPLDALLLGERYATSMGVNVRRARAGLLAISGLLTAFVTAFCGPIAFIGLIVPHLARMATGSSVHITLLGACALTGAATGLLCALLSVLPSGGVIPVNALTPIIGVPVTIYILINRKRLAYFN